MKLSDGAARIRPSGGTCSCELGASQITRIRVRLGRHRGQCSVCGHWITARRNVWASTPSKRPPGSRRSNRFVRAFTNTSTASQAGSADGLKLRHDNGSVHMSDNFQSEIQYLGIEPSPAFVRQLEGKAYASFCTSCEPRRTFSENRRRFSSLTPWAFRGGLVPGKIHRDVRSRRAFSRSTARN